MTGPDEVASPKNAEVIAELRSYRAAEEAMRRRTRESMKMGENDLTALRFLLKAQRDGTVVTPGDLADHLGMKSASVTVMLDRLTKSGHLTRMPHPSDRRSLAVVATIGGDAEVRDTLGAMHSRMMEVARTLDDHQAAILNRFLHDASEALDAPLD
ncbi:MarR family winged helix-turn-helix transcriptional regulator [Herbiconiux liangxiaofengii]|uniref:MarR family winged helix-turn-helix transcriptional regulator n=1 Tax=Herbiconiux liangxiaofengii TaxID=3342795 RepID=UPI0035B8D730